MPVLHVLLPLDDECVRQISNVLLFLPQLLVFVLLAWFYWIATHLPYSGVFPFDASLLVACTFTIEVHRWCFGRLLAGQLSSSFSSSFICLNQLDKKTHTWSTREQEPDKKCTENWRLHFAHKKNKKNKHTWYKNNYDYAYRKNAEKSTRLSDRLNLDNDEKSTVWGKKFQTFIDAK